MSKFFTESSSALAAIAAGSSLIGSQIDVLRNELTEPSAIVVSIAARGEPQMRYEIAFQNFFWKAARGCPTLEVHHRNALPAMR